jgi:hypothetical protein
MESVYHIVTIRVNETSWAHVWRLRSHYLGTGYDKEHEKKLQESIQIKGEVNILGGEKHFNFNNPF